MPRRRGRSDQQEAQHRRLRRLGVAAVLAISLACAATANYAIAEGVLLWPVYAADMSAGSCDDLVPTLARLAVLSRDGLHVPASVLLGVSVLVIAWLLVKSDLWGHW